MLRVIILELDKTLVSADGVRLRPYVRESLNGLKKFVCEDGSPVQHCMITQHTGHRKKFISRLEILGLDEYFEPLDERITLFPKDFSKDLFTQALKGIHSDALLDQCLFVSSEINHLKLAETLTVKTLRSESNGLSDWASRMISIASMFNSPNDQNFRLAFKVFGQANGLENLEFLSRQGSLLNATATEWVPIRDASLGDLDGLNVAVPITVNLRQAPDGSTSYDIDRRTMQQTSTDEMVSFVKSLKAHGDIETPESTPSPFGGASHYVEQGDDGLRRLKRRGFD